MQNQAESANGDAPGSKQKKSGMSMYIPLWRIASLKCLLQRDLPVKMLAVNRHACKVSSLGPG
jgi:hypothetical protein